jgi:hypothetical protein
LTGLINPLEQHLDPVSDFENDTWHRLYRHPLGAGCYRYPSVFLGHSVTSPNHLRPAPTFSFLLVIHRTLGSRLAITLDT